MTSSTYGTAELQGDASPSPPKPYMSRVAKIALALIAGAAAVIARPGMRHTATSFALDAYSGLVLVHDHAADTQRSGGAAPVKSTPLKVQNLEAIVTGIENYLQATSASGTGSDTSRVMGTYGGITQIRFLIRSTRNPQDGKPTVAEVIEDIQDRVVNIEKYIQATHDSGGSGNSRAWDAYSSLVLVTQPDMQRSGGGKPVASSLKDQFQDLVARVAAIKKYLQATSAPGGSGNSRGSASRAMGLSGAVVDSFAARRRLGGA